MKLIIILLITNLSLIVSCSNDNQDLRKNYINIEQGSNIDQNIGDEKTSYHILSTKTAKSNLSKKVITKKILLSAVTKNKKIDHLRAQIDSANSLDQDTTSLDLPALSQTNSDQLLVGFPLDGLNKKYLFGGVITNVLGTKSEDYGILKLSDLSALHVEAGVVDVEEDFFFVLVGCFGPCNADNEPGVLVRIPVVGVNNEETHAMLDLSGLGNELNLFEIVRGPESPDNPFQAGTISSKTTRSDFSDSTLVFDVDTKIKTSDDENVTIIARWYIKGLEDFRLSDFTSRKPDDRVGFFLPDLKEEFINRLPTLADGADKKVKYYIKNVPERYKPGFIAAINEWNVTFHNLTGEGLLDYEFIDKNDPRNELIIAGDIRRHVIEWDLVNDAPYGGFGPSISDYETGQVISANVLVQGPAIEKIYKSWFKVQDQIETLNQNGMNTVAANIENSFLDSIKSKQTRKINFSLSVGKLKFNIKAQQPEYHDPRADDDEVARRLDFYDTPEGFDYDEYMAKYFQELVAHELGHNIGLRHNFRGNYGSVSDDGEGEVSSSIMEYLSKTHRHLNRISDYDIMAIKFGYLGIEPQVSGIFCTDENVPSEREPKRSAECSRNDLGTDPYGYFKGTLQKAVSIILNPGSDEASDWVVAQMKSEIKNSSQGMAAYYSSAEDTSATWTNWNLDVTRPTDVDSIKDYVAKDLNEIICDPTISEEISGKPAGESRNKVKADIKELKKEVSEHLTSFGLPTDSITKCQ